MVKSLGTGATSPKLAGTLARQGTGRRGVSVVQILKKRHNKGRICKQIKVGKEGKTPVTGHASGDKRTIQTLALVSLREF